MEGDIFNSEFESFLSKKSIQNNQLEIVKDFILENYPQYVIDIPKFVTSIEEMNSIAGIKNFKDQLAKDILNIISIKINYEKISSEGGYIIYNFDKN